MKKLFLLFVALFSFVVFANADEHPLTFQWAHSVDGKTLAGDNIIGMCQSGDYYYVATTFGSASNQDDAMNVYFDGELLKDAKNRVAVGSSYKDGNSQNNNLVLQKLDKEGNVVWSLYSKKGDVEANNSYIAPTPDGGVVLALKVRAWVAEEDIHNFFGLVDSRGKECITSIQDNVSGEYRYFLMKITPKGRIGNTFDIAGTLKKDANGNPYAKNNAYINGLTVDEAGNVYIAGNFRTDLKFLKKTSEAVKLESKSCPNWGGDPQEVVGDLFLVKLDQYLYYENSLLLDGTVNCAFFDKMVYHDGKLYLDGRIQGNGSDISLGGKSINVDTKRQTQILASVNASDLSVNYVKTLTSVPNVDNRFVIQNKGAQYLNGNVYFTGLLNGSWQKEGESKDLLTNYESKMLKGYVLKMNPETGDVEKAALRTEGGIGGFFGVYEGAEKLYAFGYDFTGGAILAPINKDTYAVETPIQVCKYGIVGIATTPIIDGENLVMGNRGGIGKATNNTASFYGTDKKFENLNCWGSVYYCYKMSDIISTGINKPMISGVASDAIVDVYTLGGVKVKSGVAASNATEGLAKGVYIVNHKKVIVK